MSITYTRHIFRSPRFQSVVNEAITFFEKTPQQPLPLSDRFSGTGVYALYYTGVYPLYSEIAIRNQNDAKQPIYVGKAVPPGWRTARAKQNDSPVLYRRLTEHARSIKQAKHLKIEGFVCRFMILNEVESDLIVPVEAALIRRYTPLWNTHIDGFGNHDPGSGRYNQAPSDWDILHPGRPWAERLTGTPATEADIIAKIHAL